jgi:chemotaxis signal transduction protein
MSSLTINLNSKSISDNQKSSIKLLVFKISKLTLALPILQVQKVIKHNPVHGSGLSYVNLTHLDDEDVAIVDLHQKLFNVSLSEASQTKGYFIISKNITGEPLGILVSEPPALVDVTAAQIRLIPDSYRSSDTLKIASHVTVISQKNADNQTIFILDLASLI